MIKKSREAILNINSEKISLFIYDSEIFSLNKIIAYCEKKYSGYQEGEFFSIEEIKNVTKEIFQEIRNKYNISVKNLVVGVPGEFIAVVNKNIEKSIRKSVSLKDINEIYLQGNTYENNDQFLPIEICPIYYKTNADTEKTKNPIGKNCSKMIANLTYILCDKNFIKIFDEILKDYNIKNIIYTSNIYSQFSYCYEIEKENYANRIFIDLGYLSTTLAYGIERNLIYSRAFSIGSGTIAGDIMLIKDIPFSHCYELLKKLNLNIEENEEIYYYITDQNNSYQYKTDEINAIAEERMYQIAKLINEAIVASKKEIDTNVPIFLSGNNLCNIRGIKEIIESITGRKVILTKSINLCYNGSDYYSSMAMINSQIKKKNKEFNVLQLNYRRQFK